MIRFAGLNEFTKSAAGVREHLGFKASYCNLVQSGSNDYEMSSWKHHGTPLALASLRATHVENFRIAGGLLRGSGR